MSAMSLEVRVRQVRGRGEVTTGAGAMTVGQPGGCGGHKQCRGDRVRWAALWELSLESW